MLLEAPTAVRLLLDLSDEVGYKLKNVKQRNYISDVIIAWLDIGYNGCRRYLGETSGAFWEREEGERRETEGSRKEGKISMTHVIFVKTVMSFLFKKWCHYC